MTIPENAQWAGKMTHHLAGEVNHEIQARFTVVLAQWQAAININHHVTNGFTHTADQVHGHYGAKYARLDVAGSGAFMVEIESGIVYGIMGYGKVDKKKVSGNIYDPSFDGAILVKTRFQHGRFDLRVQAVR